MYSLSLSLFALFIANLTASDFFEIVYLVRTSTQKIVFNSIQFQRLVYAKLKNTGEKHADFDGNKSNKKLSFTQTLRKY